MKNKRLEERRKKIPKEVDLFVKHSFDFVDRIHQILLYQGKEQKDLAKALGKSESEISKWMSGTHNFTFKTAAKIEAVLGESLLQFTTKKVEVKKVHLIISNPNFKLKSTEKYSTLSKTMSTVVDSCKGQSGNYLN